MKNVNVRINEVYLFIYLFDEYVRYCRLKIDYTFVVWTNLFYALIKDIN